VRRSKPWPPWAHPAIVILLIAGCFHLYRGAPVDGVVFVAVAIWLASAETRSPAAVGEEYAALPSSWLLGGVLLACVVVLTVAPRYGRVDVTVVGGIGIASVAVAATRDDTVPPPRRGAAWPYALVGLVAALNELTAYLLESTPAADWRHPSVSDLTDPVWSWGPTRAILVLGWLVGGVCLLRMLPGRVAAVGGTEAGSGEGAR